MSDPLAAVLDHADEATLDRLADLLAPRLAGHGPSAEVDLHDGYLAPARAAHYLGVGKRRIYDLKSMGALVPDGYDGRTPLWRRSTLDAYVRSCAVERP